MSSIIQPKQEIIQPGGKIIIPQSRPYAKIITMEDIRDAYVRKWYHDPVGWIEEHLKVYLWSLQKKVVESVFNYRQTVVRASHAVGKTFVAACIVLAFMYLRTPCKIITSAPTGTQVAKLLWSEINTLFKTRLQTNSDGFPGKCLTTELNVTDNWFAKGIAPRDEVNFQGYHSDNILVVLDETPGIRSEIISGSRSLLSGGNAHSLWIGNPTVATGHFFDAFTDPLIPSGAKHKISAYDSPNFTKEYAPKHVKKRLVSKEWVEELEARVGRNSPVFQSKVLADFILESEGQIISYLLCEQAKNREITVEPSTPKTMGVDVARFGDDLSVMIIRQGLKIDKIIVDSKRDGEYIAGHIVRICKDDPLITRINVDIIGVGASVYDFLRKAIREGHLPSSMILTGVNVEQSAYNQTLYDDLRTELWFMAQKWLMDGQIPDNDYLVADLIAPKYEYNSSGIYRMESKEKTKKTLMRSPDYGDALVLSIFGAMDRDAGQAAITARSKSQAEIMRQMGINPRG